VHNPKQNVWSGTNTKVTISADGLNAINVNDERMDVFAVKGFAISGENCPRENFPGTIIYYFEVTQRSSGSR
jgi:hypothetical protein